MLLSALLALTVACTAAAPAPIPSASPDTTRAAGIPCVILPVELCGRAELVRLPDGAGDGPTVIAFRLPPGTPVRSPVRGSVIRARLTLPSPFCGGWFASIIGDDDPEGVRYTFRGSLEFADVKPGSRSYSSTLEVRRDGTMALVADAPTDFFAGYDLLVTVSRPELAQKLFPGALARPARDLRSAATRTDCSPTSRHRSLL